MTIISGVRASVGGQNLISPPRRILMHNGLQVALLAISGGTHAALQPTVAEGRRQFAL